MLSTASLVSLTPQVFGQDTKTYSYDALGRLSQVTSAGAVNNGVNITYCHDGASNRRNLKVHGVGSSGSTVALRCGSTGSSTDFDADGRNDILWRADNGDFTDWLTTATGAFVNNDAHALTNVTTDWKIVGTGDFNGDGYGDVLWRNDAGWLTDWLGTANGGFIHNDPVVYFMVSTDWKVVGTGDFNGDGRTDILWRKSNGDIADWIGQPNGSFVSNDAAFYQNVPTSWKVAGTGDINGDGRDDIVWRNDSGAFSDWLGQATGSFVDNAGVAGTSVTNDWKIVGVADFNGDGRSDVLWRNMTTGNVVNWIGNSNGGFTDNTSNSLHSAGLSWTVVGVNDYNGDGFADILWRDNTGALTDWLGSSSGAFSDNNAAALTTQTTNWHVQGPATF